jgi:hypothetical protein
MNRCRSCQATEVGCDNCQLYRGRPCCEDCDHEPEETAVNIEDLDLLDDEHRHMQCTECQDVQLGVPFLATCGRRAIGFLGTSDEPPPNACPDCLALLDEPCPWCGAE